MTRTLLPGHESETTMLCGEGMVTFSQGTNYVSIKYRHLPVMIGQLIQAQAIHVARAVMDTRSRTLMPDPSVDEIMQTLEARNAADSD